MEQQFSPQEELLSPRLDASKVEAEGVTDVATTQEQQQVIIAELAKARRAALKRAITFGSSTASVVLLSIAYIVLISGTRSHDNALVYWLTNFGGFVPVLLLAGMGIVMTRQKPPFDAAAISRIGGVKAVPVLLDSLQMPHSMTAHKAMLTALTTLLPQMRASDASLLNAGHRRFLNDSLRNGLMGESYDIGRDAYVLAILKAYEQVGDKNAIPVVERLAKRPGNGPRRVRLREAAQACLPLLHSNLHTVHSTRTLLRASSFESSSPEMLLRAAMSQTVTPPEELLRATQQAAVPEESI